MRFTVGGVVGFLLGCFVGFLDGDFVTPFNVGRFVGFLDGFNVRFTVGRLEGAVDSTVIVVTQNVPNEIVPFVGLRYSTLIDLAAGFSSISVKARPL